MLPYQATHINVLYEDEFINSWLPMERNRLSLFVFIFKYINKTKILNINEFKLVFFLL